MSRKTAHIGDIINQANEMLARSAPHDRGGRDAIAVFLERILLDADMYAGYRYTDGMNGESDPSRRAYYKREILQ